MADDAPPAPELQAPVRDTPVRETPVRATPARDTPVWGSPVPAPRSAVEPRRVRAPKDPRHRRPPGGRPRPAPSIGPPQFPFLLAAGLVLVGTTAAAATAWPVHRARQRADRIIAAGVVVPGVVVGTGMLPRDWDHDVTVRYRYGGVDRTLVGGVGEGTPNPRLGDPVGVLVDPRHPQDAVTPDLDPVRTGWTAAMLAGLTLGGGTTLLGLGHVAAHAWYRFRLGVRRLGRAVHRVTRP